MAVLALTMLAAPSLLLLCFSAHAIYYNRADLSSLHDRGDYKAGWQLDSILSNPSSGAPPASGADEKEEELPFACLICREPFTDPVVTKCGHYFCSACALKRYRKNSKCFACGSATGGLFNKATR